MKHFQRMQIITVISFSLIRLVSIHSLLGQELKIERSEPFEIVQIYTDSSGESHFGSESLSFSLNDYAPPAPPISVSQGILSKGLIFISSPVGWWGDWHPAPAKQIMFCLIGELEVTVSDGETRRFGPGSVILVEDTHGKGHVSRVVGEERCFMAAAILE
jgi:hypothetical protein